MNSHSFQRDALINKIFDEAQKDSDIIFLSADFGAPALDKFRKELPNQFIHTGISEQNTIDLASGLALDGRKVFAYADYFIEIKGEEEDEVEKESKT